MPTNPLANVSLWNLLSNLNYSDKLEFFRKNGFAFEIHLTEHCNLNCKGCSHFSPLAPKEYMDIHSYENDMKRMSELFDEEILTIRLLGGEPLMHPQVNEFIKTASFYFPNAYRELITNGILLLKQPESFWEICRTTNTVINITRYPVPLNWSLIKETATNRNVKLDIFPPHNTKTFRKNVYDLTGSQDMCLSHASCNLFGVCCQLFYGKLYVCSISAYFRHFNNYFKLGIPSADRDSLDIYKIKDKEELYDFITAPVPCCKYCDIKNQVFDVKWGHSKKNIKEWTL